MLAMRFLPCCVPSSSEFSFPVSGRCHPPFCPTLPRPNTPLLQKSLIHARFLLAVPSRQLSETERSDGKSPQKKPGLCTKIALKTMGYFAFLLITLDPLQSQEPHLSRSVKLTSYNCSCTQISPNVFLSLSPPLRISNLDQNTPISLPIPNPTQIIGTSFE
jgi:hypothetical protein